MVGINSDERAVLIEGAEDQLVSLREWSRDEDSLRGALHFAAPARSVAAWLRHRTSGAKITVAVSNSAEPKVEFNAKRAEHAEALVNTLSGTKVYEQP